MKKYSHVLLLIILLINCTPKESSTELLTYLEKVSGDSLSAHVKYLASDSLKGRLPGTPEYELAVEYVIRKYREMDVLPAGENDSYVQPVTIRNSKINELQSSLTWNGNSRINNKDFYFVGNLNEGETEVNAEVVFSGYGVKAPELEYDDFSAFDVSGKVLLILTGAPSSFPASELAHFANWETKYKTAAEAGAIGIMIVNSNPSQDSTFAIRAHSASERGNFGVVGKDGSVFGRRVFPEGVKFSALINSITLASKEMNTAISEYLENGTTGQSMGTIETKTQSVFSEFQSANIVGKIEGSDPSLKNEYVVHTAHLDHVGIGAPVDGDSIYNGAHDNASGVASLLEIARLYQSLVQKPKRSILFVMVTAEEMGLLGSDYFVRYPAVPIENIIANVNTDMPTLIAPLLSIEPLGAEHSSLMNEVKLAAEMLDLEIMPDHMPQQVRFVRSDQYNFIKAGIPALHVKYGLKSNTEESLEEKINDYTANVYHKPSDDRNDLFDFEAGEVYVKCNFLISYFLANSPERPAWNGDSFFNRNRD